MKRLFLLIALAVLWPLELHAAAGANGIIAVVGDEIITFQDVNTDPQNAQAEIECRQQYQGAALSPALRELHLKTLNRLIEIRLIAQEFTRDGFYFSDAQTDDLVKAQIKKDYDGDENKLHAAMAYYGQTDDEYRAAVAEKAMIDFMVRENVDKKMPTPSDASVTRHSLLEAWVATIRARTYVKIFISDSN